MKKNIKVLAIVTLICLITTMSVTAYEDWEMFCVALPKYSLNTEVSTLTKSTKGTDYFTIDIFYISDDYRYIRAWTESDTLGINYSSSSYCVYEESYDVDYSIVPENNAEVVLNLDNPVRTEKKPTVEGLWSPN